LGHCVKCKCFSLWVYSEQNNSYNTQNTLTVQVSYHYHNRHLAVSGSQPGALASCRQRPRAAVSGVRFSIIFLVVSFVDWFCLAAATTYNNNWVRTEYMPYCKYWADKYSIGTKFMNFAVCLFVGALRYSQKNYNRLKTAKVMLGLKYHNVSRLIREWNLKIRPTQTSTCVTVPWDAGSPIARWTLRRCRVWHAIKRSLTVVPRSVMYKLLHPPSAWQRLLCKSLVPERTRAYGF